MKALINDEENYPIISYRLQNLKKIKNLIQKSMKGNQNQQKFNDVFDSIDLFEKVFNQHVLQVLFKILDSPEENRHLVKDALDIIYKDKEMSLQEEKEKWELII